MLLTVVPSGIHSDLMELSLMEMERANRDAAHDPNQDRFNPMRKKHRALDVQSGPACVFVMPLARMETTVAINALLDRLPDLRPDRAAPEPGINGVAFRSPAALPVEFMPA